MQALTACIPPPLWDERFEHRKRFQGYSSAGRSEDTVPSQPIFLPHLTQYKPRPMQHPREGLEGPAPPTLPPPSPPPRTRLSLLVPSPPLSVGAGGRNTCGKWSGASRGKRVVALIGQPVAVVVAAVMVVAGTGRPGKSIP